jgi:hypothetical protein
MSEQASALKDLISLFKVEGMAEYGPLATVIPMRQPQARPAAQQSYSSEAPALKAASGDSWQEF